MNCLKCNAEIPEGSQFCHKCGTKVNLTCTNCNATIPGDSQFCPKCGTKVGDAVTSNTDSNEENPEVRSHIDKGDAYTEKLYRAIDDDDETNKEKYKQKALREYSFALEINPENPEALKKRAWTYSFQDENGKARSDLRKAISICENNDTFSREDLSRLYGVLGHTYVAEEKWEKALVFLNKAIDLDSENTMALMSIGSIYLQQGNNERAEEYFDTAIDLDPENEETIDRIKERYTEEDEEEEEVIFGYDYDEETETLTTQCPNCGEITTFSSVMFDSNTAIFVGKRLVNSIVKIPAMVSNPVLVVPELLNVAQSFLNAKSTKTVSCDSCGERALFCLNCDAVTKYSVENGHAVCKECGTDCGEMR